MLCDYVLRAESGALETFTADFAGDITAILPLSQFPYSVSPVQDVALCVFVVTVPPLISTGRAGASTAEISRYAKLVLSIGRPFPYTRVV